MEFKWIMQNGISTVAETLAIRETVLTTTMWYPTRLLRVTLRRAITENIKAPTHISNIIEDIIMLAKTVKNIKVYVLY